MARRVLRPTFQHAIRVERLCKVSFRVEDFQVGDLTVTPVLDGFMIGRVGRRTPNSPWWTLVSVVADETDAVREAVTLALAVNGRVWFQEGPGRFQPVDMSGARPSSAAATETT